MAVRNQKSVVLLIILLCCVSVHESVAKPLFLGWPRPLQRISSSRTNLVSSSATTNPPSSSSSSSSSIAGQAAAAGAASAAAASATILVAAKPVWCDPKGYKPDNGSLLYLYVWSGVENAVGADEFARIRSQAAAASKPIGDYNDAKDFVATLDLTTGSPCFGRIIAETDAPTSGNEPHHVGLNQNSTVLGVGGFDSWRYNQPSMYFFDVAKNPAKPIYIKSITPVKGATADDLIRLPNGGFLVSLMGNASGGTSGRVAEIDADLNLVAEHPKSDKNIEGFNPHGLAIAAPANRFVTLDYVEYRTTLKPSTSVKYRTTARIWDLGNREIVKVIDLGPVAKGLMTARYLGPTVGNGAQFLITAGHGVLYLLDALEETAKPVYDFGIGEGHCVLSAPFKNSTRILASLYTSDQVQLLDISNLSAVKILQNINLPKNTGPHATVLSGSERLLAISTYYVQHDHGLAFTEPFDIQNEKAVRLYTVAQDGNSFTPHAKVPIINFKNLFPHKGIARPHGMAFKAVNVTNVATSMYPNQSAVDFVHPSHVSFVGIVPRSEEGQRHISGLL